jgi:replicative DNA helicase
MPAADARALIGWCEQHAAPAGALTGYVDRIVKQAGWRHRNPIVTRLRAAIESQDQEAWTTALSELERSIVRSQGLSAGEWGELLADAVDPDKPVQPAIALPWVVLNEPLDGGLWPGDYMVLSGWTNHGKSIVADMVADHAAIHGRKVHLYLVEQTPVERGRRLLARNSGVPMWRIKQRRYRDDHKDLDKVIRVLGQMPYGCTNVADWTPDEVCADIRRAGWDLAVIDGMHDFPYDDERDLSRISGSLYRTAKATGTAIVTTAHLNDKAIGREAYPPKPSMGWIKGASTIRQQADLVAFVYQTQSEDGDGEPSGQGQIWFAKGRNSRTGSVDVHLDTRMRFLPPATEGAAA